MITLQPSPSSLSFHINSPVDLGIVVNGGFETGSLSSWTASSPPGGIYPGWPPSISTVHAHSGTYSALLGSADLAGHNEQTGDCSIYQAVTIPASGAFLTFWYWPYSEDGISFDWQECQIQDNSGGFLAQVFKVCQNNQAWIPVIYDMTPYAGQTVRVWFNAHGDGAGDITFLYVDDVALVSITGGLPPQQSVAITSSDSPAIELAYSSSITASWDTDIPGSGTTPNSETIAITAGGALLPSGTYNDTLTATPTAPYILVGTGTIPMPFTPLTANTSGTGPAFSLADSGAYFAYNSSSNDESVVESWLVKFDRTSNSVAWSVKTHTVTFYTPATVNVSIDGAYVYVIYHVEGFSLSVEKYNASNGALVAQATLSASFRGGFGASDIAIVGGVEYLAYSGGNFIAFPGDTPLELFVVRTSDLSVVIHAVDDPGRNTATMGTPCAFDASGHIWRFNGLYGASPALEKIAVPTGVSTLYGISSPLPGGNTDLSEFDTLTFDPYDGTLLASMSEFTGTYKVTITGTPSFGLPNSAATGYGFLSPPHFGPRVATTNTSRLNGGATFISIAGFVLLSADLLKGWGSVGVITDNNARYPHNLDATTTNPHKTAVIDMTFWVTEGIGLGGAAPNPIFKWFDISLVNPFVIPITLISATPPPPIPCMVQLTGGNFQDGYGRPLANGYLELQLTHDELCVVGSEQIVADRSIFVPLDATGNVPTTPAQYVAANDAILPTGSEYLVRLRKRDGVLAWSTPHYWTLTGTIVDVGTIVPGPTQIVQVDDPTTPVLPPTNTGGGSTVGTPLPPPPPTPPPEDMVNYFAMDSRRSSFHLHGSAANGSASNIYNYLDPATHSIAQIKSPSGWAADIQLYDDPTASPKPYMYQFMTELDDPGFRKWSDPSSYKKYVINQSYPTPHALPMMSRFKNIGDPDETIIMPTPNNFSRYTACGLIDTINRGPVTCVNSGPVTMNFDSSGSLAGNLGNVQVMIHQRFAGNSRERFYFAKGLGFVKWDAATLVSGSPITGVYNITNWSVHNQLAAGGGISPSFSCGYAAIVGNP